IALSNLECHCGVVACCMPPVHRLTSPHGMSTITWVDMQRSSCVSPCYTPVRTGFAAAAVGRTELRHASSSGAGTPAPRESAHPVPPPVDRQRAEESPDRHALTL